MSSRFLPIALVALVFAFLIPNALPVLAQADGVAAVGAATNLGNADLISTVGNIIKVVLGLVGIFFLVIVIYSGFLWMTAGGDAKQVERAKAFLINAVIGIVIILFAYGITSFIVNLLVGATGSGGSSGGPNGQVTIESLSGSLGGGAIQDHYPLRSQTDVARNTNIIVTFREPMNVESLIAGYDTSGTPTDLSDDIAATAINAENVKIYRSAEGEDMALTAVEVYAAADLKTFVFNPTDYLGSATEDVSYTVVLENDIEDADGNKVFTGVNSRGYEWSFATGVNLDLDPPRVLAVTPVAGGTYAKNIVVQMTFNEAIDPTSATGERTASEGFSNIQVVANGGAPSAGNYIISNGYRTITFESSTNCGTNSCNETIFCLPGGEPIQVTAVAADTTASPPQADSFPYDGIVDVAANSLDGDGDGTAGDDYSWTFTTTDSIYLEGTAIESLTPNILQPSVALDQEISMTFADILMSSTVNSDNVTLTNKEIVSGEPHEQWYRLETKYLTAAGEEVVNGGMIPAKSLVTIPHGVLLESIDGKSYMYAVQATQGLRNEYQNCYLPAEGPDQSGGECVVSPSLPYCCNGAASALACSLF